MNASLATTLTCAFTGIMALSTLAQDKATLTTNPSGTWRWEYELGGQTMKDALLLNLGKDNKLVGHYRGRGDKLIEIKDATMAGDTLSFLLSLEYQGTPVKLEFKGKVNEDEIDGGVVATTSEGSQEFPWAPKRSVLMEDVVGQWQMKIDAGDRTLEPVVTISKDGEKYTAKYVSGQDLNVDVADLKVENNQLRFTVAAEVNGTKIRAEYQGRPYGDKIQGSIAYDLGGNSGDVEFTGIRKPVEKK